MPKLNLIILELLTVKDADIKVRSIDNFKGIKCPAALNSAAIDEFLIIFLVAAKAEGISYIK